ncbi:MAG: aminotransferase class III-fold pyridoxal phosphate-dependent enzyme [Gammaproteobacteria bacterium]|nr:aminotransferase class III-fold pyridoxal phosphate-dependent enzyme [Gammaproteobacteria bacterium]
MSSILYPITNPKAVEQLMVERGEGIYVWDNAGNKYIEGLAGLWCTALGYGNQELVDTAAEAMSTLSFSHLFGGKAHQLGIDLADKLTSMVPTPDARVFFGNSGSDANDTHVKLLRYLSNVTGHPEKRKIITRDAAYHGVTLAAGALTSLPANLKYFDPPLEALGILRTDAPYYYRDHNDGESEEEFVDRIVGNLESLILAEGPETIAAMLCEPVTGGSGVIVAPDGYYQKVQAVLRKYNIMFWADEVITGFGRTGKVFGCETMGIEKPEMMTLAKQLSSAYFPISAAVMTGEMYEALVEPSAEVGVFGHGYTYSGHPVGCAIALKALEIYERDDLYGHAAKVGGYLQKRIREFEDHELVGNVRGVGLIGGIEITADKATRKSFDPSVAAYLQNACQDNGLIGRALAGTTFAICPPLIITEEQVDELIEKFSRGLDATAEFVSKQRKAS